MIPLHHEPHFTFHFADERIIPRFHLEGVECGRRVSVFRLDPVTGERRNLIAMATTGEGGWVDLSEPVLVRTGEGFAVVPEEPNTRLRGTAVTTDESVRLRPIHPADLSGMFTMQLDPESNRMAATIPRTKEAFDAHWAKSLGDPANTTRAVLLGEEMVGYISCFPMDGQDHVGYWIDRAYWGIGIASRALQLLLREVTNRPLVASAATSDVASIRVLQKCGFVVEGVRLSPASDRYPECEEVVPVLR